MLKDFNRRNIAVFIASPGDLEDERQQFRDAILQLNAGLGDGANIHFEALGWEDRLATGNKKPDKLIIYAGFMGVSGYLWVDKWRDSNLDLYLIYQSFIVYLCYFCVILKYFYKFQKLHQI